MKRHRKSPLKRIVFLSLFLMLVSIALGSSINVIKQGKIWLLSGNAKWKFSVQAKQILLKVGI